VAGLEVSAPVSNQGSTAALGSTVLLGRLRAKGLDLCALAYEDGAEPFRWEGRFTLEDVLADGADVSPLAWFGLEALSDDSRVAQGLLYLLGTFEELRTVEDLASAQQAALVCARARGVLEDSAPPALEVLVEELRAAEAAASERVQTWSGEDAVEAACRFEVRMAAARAPGAPRAQGSVLVGFTSSRHGAYSEGDELVALVEVRGSVSETLVLCRPWAAELLERHYGGLEYVEAGGLSAAELETAAALRGGTTTLAEAVSAARALEG
jgi:hypothetical protein